MLWFKCSFLIFAISTSAMAQRFTSDECLKGEFEASIKHEGRFFGLLKNELKIKKNHCLIDIKFKNILETKWLVDICREPIHIKVHSKGSQSVYKRKTECSKKDPSDFCVYWGDLNETLQDYGLIFADGERESLTTDHGRTYCTYILLKKYLNDGHLFSKYDTSVDLFGNTVQKVQEAPSFTETITPKQVEVMAPDKVELVTPQEVTTPEQSIMEEEVKEETEARF